MNASAYKKQRDRYQVALVNIQNRIISGVNPDVIVQDIMVLVQTALTGKVSG